MIYKFIFIFLSCSDVNIDNCYYIYNEKYEKLKLNIQSYFSNYKKDIKYFFLEYKKKLSQDICEIDNYIYVNGEETVVPGVLKKLKKCVNYINSKYNYEYIIRLNLTTLFNLNNLLNLYNNIPKSLFGGIFIFDSFISGMAIFISYDLTYLIFNTIDENQDQYEDVALTKKAISENIDIFKFNVLDYTYKHFQDNEIYLYNDNLNNITLSDENNSTYEINDINLFNISNEINNNINKILFYRLKTNNFKIDINNTNLLIKKFIALKYK
jgi:hypothetical protein